MTERNKEKIDEYGEKIAIYKLGPGIELHLFSSVKRQGDIYISSCPILGVMSQGPTQEEAMENLIDAMKLFVSSRMERGVLERVLVSLVEALISQKGE